MSEHQDLESQRYAAARAEIEAALEEVDGEAEASELVCRELDGRFGHYSWVGIYRVEGDELVLSAWSGPEATEHTTIGIGEGICGLAARTGRTEVVPDVQARPEFIACFPSTRSEIVVPIHAPDGTVLGEIDIDSDWLDAFDERDKQLLEAVAARLSEVMVAS